MRYIRYDAGSNFTVDIVSDKVQIRSNAPILRPDTYAERPTQEGEPMLFRLIRIKRTRAPNSPSIFRSLINVLDSIAFRINRMAGASSPRPVPVIARSTRHIR